MLFMTGAEVGEWPEDGRSLFVNQRRHTRYDVTGCALSWTQPPSGEFDSELGLLNLSCGGMCFCLSRPLENGTIHEFRIDLRRLLGEVAFVKAQIRWVQRGDPSKWMMGAAFLQSNKGWLGPEIDY